MPIQIICLLLILLPAIAESAGSSTICYNDGTIVVIEAFAIKGIIEIPVAAGFLEGTLKVEPAVGTTIVNVDISPAKLDSRSSREIEALTEQRRRLEDRLQALATREEIFKSAAKTQSGKAPRKTKSNPDPMKAIRQGTDFAIAQLETVYTTKRKTLQEISSIDARIALAGKKARLEESYARITVTPERGRATVRYATSEKGWRPDYDVRLAGDGFATLKFSARFMGSYGGSLLQVSPASISESATALTIRAIKGGNTTFASYRFPVSEESYGDGIYNHYSGLLTNTSTQHLPPGEARLYKSGAYLGKFIFDGLSSGKSKKITIGKQP